MPDNQVQVVISANLDALKQGMTDAANSVRAGAEEMKDSLGGLSDMFDSLHETVMGLIETFGAYEGIKFGVEIVKSGAEMGEQLVVLSKQTGVNLEDLSRLKFAAQSTGSDFDRFGTMIGTLDQKLLQLHSSTSVTIRAGFAQLGIDPNKLKSTSDALDKISAAIQRMGSTPQSIGALREILGRQGSEAIPMLSELKELEAESDRLGATLDGKTVESAWHVQEAFNTLGAVWDAEKTKITASLEPALETVALSFQSLVEQIDTLIRSGQLREWAEQSVTAMGDLFRGIIAVSQAFEGFEDLMRGSAASSGIFGKAGMSQEQIQTRIDEINEVENKLNAKMNQEPMGGINDTQGLDLIQYYENQKKELEQLKTTASPASSLIDMAGPVGAAGRDTFAPWIENAQEAAKAAAQLKQQLQQNFADVESQSKLEAAAAGDTANAKVEAARRVFLAAQTFFGTGSKQADTAETSLYGAENARDTQNQSRQAQDLTTAEKYGVKGPDGQYVGGEAQLSQERATTEQSLALKVINPEQAAEEEQAQDDKIFGLRENLYKQLAALYPADSKEAERANAEEAQAESEYATKRIEDATKIATTSKQAATSMADAWRGALEPLMSSFDSFFDLIVQGTNKAKGSAEQMRLEMEKLERSTLLDLAKSGMKGVMFGGKEGTTQGALFGGGMVGEASQLAMGTGGGAGAGGAGGAGNAGILGWLLGPSQANAMMSAMKGTGGNTGGLIGWLFGTSASSIMAGLGMTPGSPATQPPGSQSKPAAPTAGIAGGAASSAEGSVSSTLIGDAMKPLQQPIKEMVTHLATMASDVGKGVAQAAEGIAQDAAYYAESLIDFAVMVAHDMSGAIGNIFGFAGGGIVPSAAGGMVVGGGATFALLHEREMVLPRHLSEGFQNMLGQGDSPGGGDIHTHFHVTAMDGKSVSDFFDRHGDDIARSIHRSVRNQNPIMHAAIRMGAR